MHQIRATAPPECVSEIADLAHGLGIERVTIADVFVHGPNGRRQVVSIQTSTPLAQTSLDALGTFDAVAAMRRVDHLRELRAIVDGTIWAARWPPLASYVAAKRQPDHRTRSGRVVLAA